MTRIKICGLTRVEDAVAAARLGADAIGLVFYPSSPRYVSLERARAIVAALPPFVTVVGLFVDADRQTVEQTLASCPIDLLQFHGEEAPAYCRSFARPYLKAVRMRPGMALVDIADHHADARGLLVDAWVEDVPGGSGQTFDWSLLPSALPVPLILSGGLDPANVTGAVRTVRPAAVDVSSGVESAKGIKDAGLMAAFISGVKNGSL